MDNIELFALILAILLALAQILNILVDINFIGWVIYISWIGTIDNIAVSIVIMIGACSRFPASRYNNCKWLLVTGDIISFFVLIMFIVILGLFTYPKLINLILITPLIVLVDKIQKKLMLDGNMQVVNPMVVQPNNVQQVGTPMVAQNVYQPTYPNPQPGYDPNLYQPPATNLV